MNLNSFPWLGFPAVVVSTVCAAKWALNGLQPGERGSKRKGLPPAYRIIIAGLMLFGLLVDILRLDSLISSDRASLPLACGIGSAVLLVVIVATWAARTGRNWLVPQSEDPWMREGGELADKLRLGVRKQGSAPKHSK